MAQLASTDSSQRPRHFCHESHEWHEWDSVADERWWRWSYLGFRVCSCPLSWISSLKDSKTLATKLHENKHETRGPVNGPPPNYYQRARNEHNVLRYHCITDVKAPVMDIFMAYLSPQKPVWTLCPSFAVSFGEIKWLSAPVLLHSSTDDHSLPAEQTATLIKNFKTHKIPTQENLYEGADHGFLAHTRPTDKPDTAKLSRNWTISFLKKNLRVLE